MKLSEELRQIALDLGENDAAGVWHQRADKAEKLESSLYQIERAVAQLDAYAYRIVQDYFSIIPVPIEVESVIAQLNVYLDSVGYRRHVDEYTKS